MFTENDWTQFEKRRSRLTRFWLGLLLFNIFLQFDVAEKWFDKQIEPQVVLSEIECSKLPNIRGPQEQELSQFLSLLPLGLPQSHHKKLSTSLIKKDFDFNQIQRAKTCASLVQIYKATSPFKSSGLSPPYFI